MEKTSKTLIELIVPYFYPNPPYLRNKRLIGAAVPSKETRSK
jgi:hypothetical protein